MATTRFIDHLLEGDHASRPAAGDVPEGTLYSCTTHSLIYQSDTSTWSTWATLGGSSDLDAIIAASAGQNIADALAGAASPTAGNVFATMADVGGGSDANEVVAAVLTDATSAGDAGSRADHFLGTSLSGNWTQEASALSTGPFVKYSAFGGSRTGGVTHYRQSYTPSGALRVEAKGWMEVATNSAGIGLLIRDSGSGDSSGDGMLAMLTFINGDNSRMRLLSLDSGSYTDRQSIPLESFGDAGGNVIQRYYIYISRNGSNVWQAGYSLDRTMWMDTGTHSKTFTVAKLAVRMDSINAFGWDFVDVVT